MIAQDLEGGHRWLDAGRSDFWRMWLITAAVVTAVVGPTARIGASVVYYGSLVGPSLRRAAVSVLGYFADEDPYEPDAVVAAFTQDLVDGGRAVMIHRYGAAGHWFAEPNRDAFRPRASDLAFDRTVAFLTDCLTRSDQSSV